MAENNITLTRLLQAFSRGDYSVANELLPLIYLELKQIASRRLRNENDDISICTTDLVHETYLKLFKQENQTWQNRAQFFAHASEAMRQILVDRARKLKAAKRNGAKFTIPVEDAPELSALDFEMILIVNDALEKLDAIDPRQSKIVKLRYFTGLTIEETAFVMGISEATVKRDWRFAKAWLTRELEGAQHG